MTIAIEIIRRTIQSDLDNFRKTIQKKEAEYKKNHVHEGIDDVLKHHLERMGYPVDEVMSQDQVKFQLDYDVLNEKQQEQVKPLQTQDEQKQSGVDVYNKFMDSLK